MIVYGARMVLPAAVYHLEANNILFTIYFNLWEDMEWDGNDVSKEYDDFMVFSSDGTELEYLDPYDYHYAVVAKSEIEDNDVTGEHLLIGVNMHYDAFINVSNLKFPILEAITSIFSV